MECPLSEPMTAHKSPRTLNEMSLPVILDDNNVLLRGDILIGLVIRRW